jgi:hypothetical protein
MQFIRLSRRYSKKGQVVAACTFWSANHFGARFRETEMAWRVFHSHTRKDAELRAKLGTYLASLCVPKTSSELMM